MAYENNIQFVIQEAREIVRMYQQQRDRFIDINLAVMTAYSFLFVYMLSFLNLAGQTAMLIGIITYFSFSLFNISKDLRRGKTEGICRTLNHYRKWKTDNLEKCLSDENYPFKSDFKLQIKNLHKFQKQYHKKSKIACSLTLAGLIDLITTFIISILISYFGNDFTGIMKNNEIDWIGYIIIIICTIIPSGVIMIGYFYLKKKGKLWYL